MIKIALSVFFSSTIALASCNSDNPVVRLDGSGGSLENFKTIDQDGMGICYSAVASVLLKSAYPNEDTPSQIDLAMKYAKEFNEPEDSLRQYINAGFTHKAFNLAVKEKICKAADVNFEVASNVFGSRAMKDYFDSLQYFKDSFDQTNPDKEIYFDKLAAMSADVKKECDKNHNTLIQRSIKNAYYGLYSYYTQTKNEVDSLKQINIDIKNEISKVEEIEEDSKKLRDKKLDLLAEIKAHENEQDTQAVEKKTKRLKKVEEKLYPYESQFTQIKEKIGRDLFAPSSDLLSLQMKGILKDNQSFINDLAPEVSSAKTDLDEIGAFVDGELTLSKNIKDYLAGDFKKEMKDFSSDYKKIIAIDEDAANKFYSDTLRKKFSGLDEIYLTAKGTQLDFKMNNPFYCAQNYLKENLDKGESAPFYNMCTQYEKSDVDKSSYNALASLLKSGSNIDKFFENLTDMIDHLEEVTTSDDGIFDKAQSYLAKQCVEKINYRYSPKKSSKPIYLGVGGSYDKFKTDLKQKKKVLNKFLTKSLDNGHAIGLSIAGKMLKESYNAHAEEMNDSLETEDFEHGLHAVALIGVDCSSEKKKYLIQNSWGTSCLGVKDIPTIKCEEGTGRLWIEEDYLLNNTRYLSVVK